MYEQPNQSVPAQRRAASRTPPNEPRARAWALGSIVTCTDLHLDDPEMAAEVEQTATEEDAGVILQTTLELGARVRKLARASADTVQLADQVRRLEETFQRVSRASCQEIMKSVRDATDTEGGLIPEAVKRETCKLTGAIERAFDEDDKRSALAKIQKAVEETVQHLGQDSTRTVQRLLDAADPASPMAKLQSNIRKDIVAPVNEMLSTLCEVKEAIEVRLAVSSEQEKGTQKGRKYEEFVSECLERYAAAAGDQIEHVGDTIGAVPRCKNGDDVATVQGPNGSSSRIVFEAKDRSLSLPKIGLELDQAAENRQAQIAVMVFARQVLAPCSMPLHRVAPNRWLVVLDKETQDELALRLAFQIARLEALNAMHQSTEVELDVDYVLDRIAEARKLLTLIDGIEKGLNQAEKGVQDSRSTACNFRVQLNQLLDQLEDALQTEQRVAA